MTVPVTVSTVPPYTVVAASGELDLAIAPELRRHDAAALDLVLMRIDFGFDEGANRLDDHFLFFAETKIHADPPIASDRRDGRRLRAPPKSHVLPRSP